MYRLLFTHIHPLLRKQSPIKRTPHYPNYESPPANDQHIDDHIPPMALDRIVSIGQAAIASNHDKPAPD